MIAFRYCGELFHRSSFELYQEFGLSQPAYTQQSGQITILLTNSMD